MKANPEVRPCRGAQAEAGEKRVYPGGRITGTSLYGSRPHSESGDMGPTG